MPDSYRVTFHFQHSYFGFSETWYLPNVSASNLIASTKKYIYARCGILEQQYVPLAIRIAKEDGSRHSRLLVTGQNDLSDMGMGTFDLPDRGSYGDETDSPTATIGPDNSDQTRAAMQLQGLNAGRRVGIRYLVGVPDFVSLTEPKTLKDSDEGKWWSAFKRWVKAIKEDGWCVKSINKNFIASGDTPANPLIDVIGYQLLGPAPSILGVQMKLGLPFAGVQGDRIMLQKVRMMNDGLRSPNGKWIIEGIETNTTTQIRTIYLRGTERFDPSTFKTLGKFRLERYVYTPMDNLTPIRMGTHKRGKAFFTPVGRAKTRRYAS